MWETAKQLDIRSGRGIQQVGGRKWWRLSFVQDARRKVLSDTWYLRRDLKEMWKELYRHLREEVPG